MDEIRCETLAQFKLGVELFYEGIFLSDMQSLEWLSGNTAKITGWSGFYMVVQLVNETLVVVQGEKERMK